MAFDGLCVGMAVLELRGLPLEVDPEPLWRSRFWALFAGLGDREKP